MGSWRESGSEITELILQAPRNHSLGERRVVKKKVDCCLVKTARGHRLGSQRHGLETKGHTFLRATLF